MAAVCAVWLLRTRLSARHVAGTYFEHFLQLPETFILLADTLDLTALALLVILASLQLYSEQLILSQLTCSACLKCSALWHCVGGGGVHV